MEDGKPRFVTEVNTTDVADGWRHLPRDGGVVIDVQSDEIVATSLSMPHSPRIQDGTLWVQDSGRGFLVRINSKTGQKDDVAFCPGFLRGMSIHNGFAIACLSQARHGHFGDLAIQQELESRGEEP
jgi:uncharacterized protein (TIGR03032 family)